VLGVEFYGFTGLFSFARLPGKREHPQARRKIDAPVEIRRWAPPQRGCGRRQAPTTKHRNLRKSRRSGFDLQFLGFVADGRTYGETMEAWRSTCPRLPIWEDAVRDGLVRIENSGAMKSSRVVLTARGKARLSASGRHGSNARVD